MKFSLVNPTSSTTSNEQRARDDAVPEESKVATDTPRPDGFTIVGEKLTYSNVSNTDAPPLANESIAAETVVDIAVSEVALSMCAEELSGSILEDLPSSPEDSPEDSLDDPNATQPESSSQPFPTSPQPAPQMDTIMSEVPFSTEDAKRGLERLAEALSAKRPDTVPMENVQAQTAKNTEVVKLRRRLCAVFALFICWLSYQWIVDTTVENIVRTDTGAIVDVTMIHEEVEILPGDGIGIELDSEVESGSEPTSSIGKSGMSMGPNNSTFAWQLSLRMIIMSLLMILCYVLNRAFRLTTKEMIIPPLLDRFKFFLLECQRILDRTGRKPRVRVDHNSDYDMSKYIPLTVNDLQFILKGLGADLGIAKSNKETLMSTLVERYAAFLCANFTKKEIQELLAVQNVKVQKGTEKAEMVRMMVEAAF